MLTARPIVLSTLVLFLTLNKYTVCVRDRVVGGEASPIHYKYQISLQVNRNLQWLHNCGGSILSRMYVITAAHCVKGGRPEQLSVVAGTSDLSKPGYRHLIASFVIHPKYKELRTSDIAIMKVTTPFIYNPMVGPIKYSDRHVGGNQRTMLTGWGYTFPIRIGAPPKMLQRAEFMTLSNKQCIIRGLRPTSTEICAYKRLLIGACGGDSGGPLVNNGELIGIVSYGTAICASGLPDVYTRVSVFYDWIRENTDFTSPAKDSDTSVEEVVDEEVEKEEDSGKDEDDYNEEPEVIERNHAIFNNPMGDKISSSYLQPGSRTPVFGRSYPLFYSKKSMPILYGDVDLPITFYELDEFR